MTDVSQTGIRIRISNTTKASASMIGRITKGDRSAGMEVNHSVISDGRAAGATGFHPFACSVERGQSSIEISDSEEPVLSWLEIFLISPEFQDRDSEIGITRSL